MTHPGKRTRSAKCGPADADTATAHLSASHRSCYIAAGRRTSGDGPRPRCRHRTGLPALPQSAGPSAVGETRRHMHLPKSARRTACAAALLVASLAFAGCGSSSKEPEYVEQPVEQLYNNAMDALDEGNYQRAADRKSTRL